ncbi:AIS_HP2_G0019800.mRNA.1.CDS.1 [Saccharomyces cerevisiae]|nr:AIS_HP2_G0019800.mRNA.1.CDS.1 [Saccharomyces cerevisiae]CAI6521539.1 AIS_HP2_G0019800.mRNA.1.CDS.1 [Saccharomyces cerevisiae]
MMVKQEEPLNEISPNTPMTKNCYLLNETLEKVHHGNRVRTAASMLTGDNPTDFDGILTMHNNIIRDFLKTASSNAEFAMENITSVDRSLTSIYYLLKSRHMLSHMNSTVKQHMMIIVKLINFNALGLASSEIISLYNETNLFQAHNLKNILLADFNTWNEYYLSNLKILALQLILKRKLVEEYLPHVLEIFSHDERFLLKDPNLKMHALIKIVLSFFSVTSTCKILFGLKFLQYIKQYKLPFKNYVENISTDSFSKKLLHKSYLDMGPFKVYLNSFYSSYSKLYGGLDKIMLLDLLVYEEAADIQGVTRVKKELSECCDMNENRLLWSCISLDDLRVVLESATDSLQNKKGHVSVTLRCLVCLWSTIRLEGLCKNRDILSQFDRNIIYINSNIKSIEDGPAADSLSQLLTILSEICIDYGEFKRLANVISLFFNASVLFKSHSFLLKTTCLEIRSLLLDNDSKTTHRTIMKFEKFVSSAQSIQKKLEVFCYLFNVYCMVRNDSLSFIFDFCQNVFVHCFTRLKTTKFIEFSNCSEVMLSILYGSSSIESIPSGTWSQLTRMIFCSLKGKFDLDSSALNCKLDKLHLLNKYELLIRIVYLLNLDMSKHLTTNLSNITKMYMNKWLNRSYDATEKISSFEVNFVKMLLCYLNFNSFDKQSIELSLLIKSKEKYFSSFTPYVDSYLLDAYLSLHMIDDASAIKSQLQRTINLRTAKMEQALLHVDTLIDIYLWESDLTAFQIYFGKTLPAVRPELFDINNDYKLPMSLYIKVILLNIKLFNGSAKLNVKAGNVVSAVLDCKKAQNLSLSLLNKKRKLSQASRLALLKSLSCSFFQLINVYIRIGSARDCEFYSKELSKILSDFGEPIIVYRCLHFLNRYYMITEQSSLQSVTLKKANKAFDYLDAEADITSLTMFLYDNEEFVKLEQSLVLFFGDQLPKTFLPNLWRLNLGEDIDDSICLPEYKAKNIINKANNMWRNVVGQLEEDPFFKGMFESTLGIPSSSPSVPSTVSSNVLRTPLKHSTVLKLCDSPRSSNMTPKGKNMKQKFDRMDAIDKLKRMKQLLENLKLDSLENHELSKIASLFSLTLTILSNITNINNVEVNLITDFSLIDLPRHMPLLFDKALNNIDKTDYRKFHVSSLITTNSISTTTENDAISSAQLDIMDSNLDINVITIDFCSVTGNLLLSKLEPQHKRRVHLRLPLIRSNSRDLDEAHFSFPEARKELISIIKESNETTSVEVTSKIKTREERKSWWTARYELDKRMQTLLNNIENSWFNGVQGFFSPEIVDSSLFVKFKDKFYEILHQNLPSRKLYGKPTMFIKVQDWIIELFLKLNPQEADFLSKMEDLIYFVLDILLFHGEENAYDEIDFSMLHVQLEEQIKKFRANMTTNSIFHTFLIVSSSCHLFPWECLTFLRDMSITRVPSYVCLNQLLLRFHYKLPIDVSIKDNISMVLNPNGDLSRTESKFKDMFQKIIDTKPSSQLVMNEKPDEETLLNMLQNSNLFVYIGHGGGEQYIRGKEIKKCVTVAPSFLLGCSSAAMRYYGELEPTGTIYTYLLGGCPMVLGNLWDVTDKDIDKFSEELFEKMGLSGSTADLNDCNLSVSHAVSKSRTVCHLRFLNGAAPVIYGLPIKFTL